MSSASPAPLSSEPSDELLGPASPGSPVPAKRTLDRSPSDRAGKRAKGRTNKSTWNEARGPYEERGEKARDSSYHEIWYCKHCDSTKKPNSITTNLSRARKHLQDFHGIRVIEHVERSDLKKQQHGTITDLFGGQEERQANRDLNEEKYLANAINIPAFEEALARLLAVRNIAHTFIESPEFHAVILSCNYMARDVLLRSRRAVPKLLKKAFAQHKQGLVKKLHNSLSSMVHFTIDMWTSSEQKAAYQAIVVHFVDAETRGVAQALLSLREFKGSHNGKLQAKAFLEVVEEYDLRGKVGYFTMDNHDANDTMLDDIAKEIDGLDPVARRLRCSGHIMNLIVQAFLFRSKAKKIQEDEREGIDEAYERLCRLSEREEGGIITKAQATEEWREFSVLGKLHNLCIYSRSSTSIYNDFKAEIGRALPRDNDTRWNSWFRLIDVAIENRAKFMDWIQENHAKIEKDALDHNDWNELGDIHAFLQVFHQISVPQGRENTLDEVLSHMDFLHHHFTRTKNRAFSGPRFYARFHVAWLKFEKYYQLTEQAPVYVAGILLHPALRKSYLSEQWKRNPAWVSNAVKAVRKIWSTDYKSYQLPDEQQEKEQELDEFDRWRQKVYSTASDVKDEFDRFIYGSQVGIGQQTALQWWLEPTQRENFPLLCRMAIDIFCIPPMSTEAERIFSGARRQPMDVGVFQFLKEAHQKKLCEALRKGNLTFGRRAFAGAFQEIFNEGFTAAHIISGFQKTGIYPSTDRPAIEYLLRKQLKKKKTFTPAHFSLLPSDMRFYAASSTAETIGERYHDILSSPTLAGLRHIRNIVHEAVVLEDWCLQLPIGADRNKRGRRAKTVSDLIPTVSLQDLRDQQEEAIADDKKKQHKQGIRFTRSVIIKEMNRLKDEWRENKEVIVNGIPKRLQFKQWLEHTGKQYDYLSMDTQRSQMTEALKEETGGYMIDTQLPDDVHEAIRKAQYAAKPLSAVDLTGLPHSDDTVTFNLTQAQEHEEMDEEDEILPVIEVAGGSEVEMPSSPPCAPDSESSLPTLLSDVHVNYCCFLLLLEV
ncbi:hypothetical protein FPOA_12362 [Fusarium poae]|uniref:HAT C-terminal dimerisation domain-containing protein n=1 Tax=Fusarium poae TaxID=36050 RepID=A0A1B8A9D0_FUSPO|nr:hypothetical protein FPOA_12362 [Fusarium poae]